MKIRRALVSVYRKDGVEEFCRRLRAAGVEIVSTGGTARLLSQAGLQVRPVEEVTGFPEMLDGRVKTLHPRIHAGILARRGQAAHEEALRSQGIDPIDLVAVNLYPFAEAAARPGATFDEVLEMIDIGGPAMVRSAAKNHEHVAVVVDPGDYETVAEEIAATGGLAPETRRRLAVRAFRATARYDAAIEAWLAPPEKASDAPPAHLALDLERAWPLRYGENPHQPAAFYLEPADRRGTVAGAAVLQQGKALSFNNLLDLDAAVALVQEFPEPAAAIIKHTNPCGAALGPDPAGAFVRARETDPVSAFGGIVALNREVDGECARAIREGFVEAVAAPGFSAEARKALAARKNLRLLEVGQAPGPPTGWDVRRIRGGYLVQAWDHEPVERSWRVVTRRAPSEEEARALRFAWTVVRHVKSNAIVFTSADRTLGLGAGQMSRVDAVHLARHKARLPLQGSAVASDAFFPFRDGVDGAAEAGATAVIQPGGSMRDQEVIDAADQHGMAMVFTGVRHFRH